MSVPIVIAAPVKGQSLREYLRENLGKIEQLLSENGALLFQGFGVNSAQEFQDALEVVTPKNFEYRGGGSPRTGVSGKISTSTEYAASQHIPLHIEGSYFPIAPSYIWFFAQHPVKDRGNTPIGDMRKFLQSIDPSIVEEFEVKGLVYVNNLHDGSGFGRSWQEAYGCKDKQHVSQYLESRGYTYFWKQDGGLRVDLRAPAVRNHRNTGQPYWCNQALNWHPAAQETKTRGAIAKIFGDPQEFPKNVFFGDYSEIPDEVILEIDKQLQDAEVIFDWQINDVLLLDNQWMSHGRQPYSDPARKILVSLAT